jgi:hypothetical protein
MQYQSFALKGASFWIVSRRFYLAQKGTTPGLSPTALIPADAAVPENQNLGDTTQVQLQDRPGAASGLNF